MRITVPKVPWPSTAVWLVVATSVSAALAVFSGRHYLLSREAELRQQASAGLEWRPVVVASHELSEGASIREGDLAVRQVPGRFADSASLLPEEAGKLVGHRVLRPRRAGDVLTRRDVDGVAGTSLALRIEAGMRAVALPVDELGSLSGLIRPGDRVDLYFLPTGSSDDARIGLLLPAVLVLATGSQTGARAPGPESQQVGQGFATITVQVLPDDAQRISLAQRAGQVVPVLRGEGDASPTAGRLQRARQLLAASGNPSFPAANRPEKPSLELILGGMGTAVASRDTLPVPPVPSPMPQGVHQP